MNWTVHGAESGPTLVCLHGFMGDACDWDAFGETFLRHMGGWRVVAPTLPGHEDVPDVFTARAIGPEILEWMDAQGIETAVLAGYSLGGRLGLRIALDNPDRFPAFVGISTTAGISDSAARESRRLSDHLVAERLRSCRCREGFREFLEEWWSMPLFFSTYRSEAQRAAFLTSRLKKSPVALASALEQWSPGVLPSEWERLSGYTGRVLLVSGEEDRKFSDLSDRMQALFSDVRAHRLIAAGHQLLIERAAEVAAIVAYFLNEEQSDRADE